MTDKTTVKTSVVRHESNPFVNNMVVPVRDQRIKISRLGKDDNVLINHATGESHGTHVTTFRRVDADQFVKLFTANIALTFDLKAAGIKAFNVLLWIMQNKSISKDLVPLDKFALEEFLQEHSDRKPPIALSQPTFWRGLAELEKAQIIAKHIRAGWYYINPNFAFNGDRIAFTTLIERTEKRADTKTIDMFDNEEQQA
jgi:hypothetical protein